METTSWTNSLKAQKSKTSLQHPDFKIYSCRHFFLLTLQPRAQTRFLEVPLWKHIPPFLFQKHLIPSFLKESSFINVHWLPSACPIADVQNSRDSKVQLQLKVIYKYLENSLILLIVQNTEKSLRIRHPLKSISTFSNCLR